MALALYSAFISLEPQVGQSANKQFEITQTVTEEITFVLAPSNVTLSPALSGITGGTSNGATQVRVRTNNSTGYSMTMVASTSPAMQGDTQGDTIEDFSTTTNPMAEPEFNFTETEVPDTPGHAFGYTVEATTSTDVDQSFLDGGSSDCNTGSTQTASSCWIGASTTAYTIINRASETPGSGATTTLRFRVVIDANATDTTSEDTYTATTTLTATVN